MHMLSFEHYAMITYFVPGFGGMKSRGDITLGLILSSLLWVSSGDEQTSIQRIRMQWELCKKSWYNVMWKYREGSFLGWGRGWRAFTVVAHIQEGWGALYLNARVMARDTGSKGSARELAEKPGRWVEARWWKTSAHLHHVPCPRQWRKVTHGRRLDQICIIGE